MAEETVPLEAFFDIVLGIVPKASSAQAKLRIVDAVVEAAKATRQIRPTRYADSQAGVSEYPIPLDEGYSLALVEKVCVNGVKYTGSRVRPCGPVTFTPAEQCVSSCSPVIPKCSTAYRNPTADGYVQQGESCGGEPEFYVDQGQSLVLSPPPSADAYDGIEITMSVFPSRFSCVIPLGFFEMWKEEIGIGAAVKLLRNDSTYNRAKYQDFNREWQVAKNKMKAHAQNQYVNGDETMGREAERDAGRKLV